MKKILNLKVDVELVDTFKDNDQTVARVFYPEEGNKIQIIKGLNTIELSEAIFHEIGHLIDWYLSNGQQGDTFARERNAKSIGESLRFKE